MAVCLLVTGYARSGITLVNRLLDSHPEASIADRTTLGFLTEAMTSYLTARDLPTEGYPFRPLFDEPGYDVEDVTRFFRAARWTPDSIDLAEVLRRSSEGHARSAGKSKAAVSGLREHHCEVLTPYLLERGFHVVFVLRDPLDVVASARLGDKGTAENTGWALNPRVSVLEMVRQWRKSVAMAIVTARHPRARIVRYERLVRRPGTWPALCRWLGLQALPPERLLSEPSGHWAGNSSFGALHGLSPSPVGRGALLPASVAAFVGAATAPERRLLGYERDHPDLVAYSRDAEMDPQHSPDANEAALENEREATRRRLLIETGIGHEAAHRWFIHPVAHARLQMAWRIRDGSGASSRR